MNVDLRGLVHIGEISGGYFISTFINNAMPLLVLPILTRYLNPGQYANVALFSLCLVLVNSLTAFSLSNVISKHFFDSERDELAKLIGGSIFILAAISLVTIMLILIAYPILRDFVGLSLAWLILVPITSFASGVYSIGLTVMRNEKKPYLFGRHQIGNTVIDITTSLLLVVLLLWGWQGRVGGIIISYSISALVMLHYLKANHYLSLAGGSRPVQGIMRAIVSLMPHSFQSVVIYQAGLLFIQLFFSKELLGIYAVALQIAFAVKLLNNALALAWSPYLYEQLARQHMINKLYLSRMLLTLAAIMSMGVLFIILFSKIILKIMASKPYLAAREFIPWLALGFLFQGLSSFLMPVLIKLEKQNYISMVSFMNMLLMIMLNVLFIKAFGYIGTAYAFFVVYFLMFLAFAWKSQRVFPLPWLRALRVLG